MQLRMDTVTKIRLGTSYFGGTYLITTAPNKMCNLHPKYDVSECNVLE